ncbi:MAG: hypothetical protein A2319_03500 [Candidatus Kerfeldbacteria bacterium RIFOXYB2_FULL_38_14]|uniref:Glycosyltransferase 2-like domain-containing protein n=1 Tax=Candidatus Kerfeldbacteria bacterium RIFOXYB2_FULL_38_14 TaxID=1798547 RepID=A0A1G2BI53_9BACT|nr:MAG: hypothetical protein A2319_03500 [Candidatus Kerfeldbacteria bacterium RIFOXYB2_FULL_38_14]
MEKKKKIKNMTKLIVTIPVYNEEENLARVIKEVPRRIPGIDRVEVLVFDDGSTDQSRDIAKVAGADYVFYHHHNKGLAITFKDALWTALKLQADFIVNTDGDNHYDQSRIPDLVKPLLTSGADITVGSRRVAELEYMPFWNKYLNRLGSFILTKWVGLPALDVSSGFRGYTKEAALRLGVYSLHTYVHTTLLSAQDSNLNIIEVPIKARPVSRKSRLIKNIPSHLWKAGLNIVRNIALFRPLRFFGFTAGVLFVLGIVPIIRFVFYFLANEGNGHIQSLILAGVLVILSFNSLMLGLLGSSLGWSRKVNEEVLYFLKKRVLARAEQPYHPQFNNTNQQKENQAYSVLDQEKIKERLKSLGYLD